MNEGRIEWSPTGVIGEAWEKVKADPVGLILPVIVVSVIQGIPNGLFGAVATAFERNDEGAAAGAVRFVSWAIGLAISAWLTGGLMELYFKAARGQPYALGDVFAGGRFFVPMLLTLFLLQVGTGIGFLLCLIPGVILALGWFFAVPLVVDEGLSPVDALRESWRMTSGLKLDLFLYWLVAFGVALLGILACCVGTLPAMAVIVLGQLILYDRLRASATPPPTVF